MRSNEIDKKTSKRKYLYIIRRETHVTEYKQRFPIVFDVLRKPSCKVFPPFYKPNSANKIFINNSSRPIASKYSFLFDNRHEMSVKSAVFVLWSVGVSFSLLYIYFVRFCCLYWIWIMLYELFSKIKLFLKLKPSFDRFEYLGNCEPVGSFLCGNILNFFFNGNSSSKFL